jgi:DNA-binding MarR family transcriptional regulator
MDLINDLGELAVATRLKRLSERLGQDISKIYQQHEIEFESKWFLTMELLKREKVLSIVEISAMLKLSHPAIVQQVDQLLKKGLIVAKPDKQDARKRLISLSPLGATQIKKIEPLLDVIKEENRKWLDEANEDLLKLLEELETLLDKKSMYDRVTEGLKELKNIQVEK